MNLETKLPKEIIDRAYRAVESAKKTGKIKKGVNEVTKAIERDNAKLVLCAQDVNPKEIIMHLPILCEEHNCPVVPVPSKTELGASAGLGVGTASVVIIKEGDAKKLIKEISDKIKENGEKS